MEGLFRLVAESFARHGIEALPASDPQAAEPGFNLTVPHLSEALPEHNRPAEAPSP